MAPTRSRRKSSVPKSLSAGRPLSVQRSSSSLSSKATRSTIQNHHRLTKQHARALASGDQDQATRLQAQIDLPAYQAASKTGQSATRGGDSSKTLVEWLSPYRPALEDEMFRGRTGRRFRMLEVGALSDSNACSTCGLFDVERIDLNAQTSGITKQDFMQRPLPKDDSEKFDMISLSLVLNYVGDAGTRGEMLRRCRDFVRTPISRRSMGETQPVFPSLFLVLPASCVKNSRYLDENRLKAIMESLGFSLIYQKLSAKLAYYLWVRSVDRNNQVEFNKKEVSPGSSRNNFAIVLKKPSESAPR